MTTGSLSGLRIRIHLIRIRIQHFRLNTDPDPGVLMTKNKIQFTDEKQIKFFFRRQKLQFTYPLASIKDVQVTKEAFSSQKRTSSTSEHEIT
jgi:hypothetical protein